MRKAFFIFKWMLTIALLVVLLIFTNNRQANQRMSLNNIKIKESPDNFVTKQIVLNYLKEKSDPFDSILMTDFKIERLESVLESHPGIKEVEVFATQKGGVDILIEQKKAIVRVKSNTEDYYLDEFGEKMRLSDNYTPKLVVATGNISTKNHAGIYEFIKEINKSDFWSAQITQVHFEKDEILLIPRVGNQKINIGSFENIVEKLDNLYQFYKVAMPVKGWQTYSDINLKFNNQIVCVKK
ncbi:MAG: hypothetical protein VX762_03615 [Bacteroidota bacterium]|nr:hypothetical protein [Bacteroidota bacterium]MEC9209494.1 hypothetical protein [Bacteroidota bacterium]